MKMSDKVVVVSHAENFTAESVATVTSPLVVVKAADNIASVAYAPIWCNKAEIERLTGVPSTVLARWIADGKVAMSKLGDSRQSAAVYKLADVLEQLEMASSRRAAR
jgi:hypothetical protein